MVHGRGAFGEDGPTLNQGSFKVVQERPWLVGAEQDCL